VRGILAEEEQHLAEMEESIESLFKERSQPWRDLVLAEEERLHNKWLTSVETILFSS
jgi:hypothetical protein